MTDSPESIIAEAAIGFEAALEKMRIHSQGAASEITARTVVDMVAFWDEFLGAIHEAVQTAQTTPHANVRRMAWRLADQGLADMRRVLGAAVKAEAS